MKIVSFYSKQNFDKIWALFPSNKLNSWLIYSNSSYSTYTQGEVSAAAVVILGSLTVVKRPKGNFEL